MHILRLYFIDKLHIHYLTCHLFQGMRQSPPGKVDLLGTKKKAKGSLQGICRNIMKHDGISGFYRGYFISLMSNVPTSGIWWASYNVLVSITKYCNRRYCMLHPVNFITMFLAICWLI